MTLTGMVKCVRAMLVDDAVSIGAGEVCGCSGKMLFM